jgi:hypothetical protein
MGRWEGGRSKGDQEGIWKIVLHVWPVIAVRPVMIRLCHSVVRYWLQWATTIALM